MTGEDKIYFNKFATGLKQKFSKNKKIVSSTTTISAKEIKTVEKVPEKTQ